MIALAETKTALISPGSARLQDTLNMESIKAVFWKPDPAAQVSNLLVNSSLDLMEDLDAKMQ